MKKLIITLVLLLATSTVWSQKQFEGLWVCEESSYITTILAAKHKITRVFSTSFKETQVLEEKLIYSDTNSFVTSIYNKRNDWTVEMLYTYINDNTIVCEYTGDYIGKIVMTRLKTNKTKWLTQKD